MISQTNRDSRVIIRSGTSGLFLLFVEVTDSARALEQCHLCGPTAGLIQAEALAAVALLGAELSGPDETITFRMDVDGPIGGFLVEIDQAGNLRGYTNVKVMNDLDGATDLDEEAAMGSKGTAQIIRSKPGKILNTAISDVRPPTVSNALDLYFRDSRQRRSAFLLSALDFGNYLDSARGILLEQMPDGNPSAYDRVVRRFDDGTALDCLERGTPLPGICRIIGFHDPIFSNPFPLRFGCRCSQDRVERMLSGLPAKDLEEMIAEGHPAGVCCHFCGKRFMVGTDRLRALLDEKGRDGEQS